MAMFVGFAVLCPPSPVRALRSSSGPRAPLPAFRVLKGPELQGLFHRQLLIDASLCDRHPLFQYDLEGRAYRVGRRTLLARTALRVSAMAFLEPASPR